MGIAANRAHAMAAHTELFARAAMTARAEGRISPCGATMIVGLPWQSEPTRRVIRGLARTRGELFRAMAVRAGRGRMTGGAKPRIAARLLGVARGKTRAVDAGTHGLVEYESSRERGCGRSMAARAKALGMTGRAHGAIVGRPDRVSLEEIPLVHEVIFGHGAFIAQIDVARVAVTRSERFFVRMTASAIGHPRPEHARVVRDIEVTAYAVSLDARHVGAVLEQKMLSRLGRTSARMGPTMAMAALVLVVR